MSKPKKKISEVDRENILSRQKQLMRNAIALDPIADNFKVDEAYDRVDIMRDDLKALQRILEKHL